MPKILLCLFSTVIIVLACLLTGVALINYGPSPAMRDLLVTTVMQTGAAKPLATWYFSEEEVARIISDNTAQVVEGHNDPSLVDTTPPAQVDGDGVEVEHIGGVTYRAVIMTVLDPSRVCVATIPKYGGPRGMTVDELIAQENGVGGVNGGEYEDVGGTGTGHTPCGLVISNGEWRYGDPNGWFNVIGFDQSNRLVVGNMYGHQALAMGVRDAVSFGPVLILDGKPVELSGNAGGLNPRTAIGQRADGAVLLLVIDGRQPNSMGGSYRDIIDIMLRYGAVNAANLDGGNSAQMNYGGKLITVPSGMAGQRYMPTAIVVR